MDHDFRPWGEYWVLEDALTHKVKKIFVKPGHRLSLQYHKHRAEVWTIITGMATVTLNDEVKDFLPGEVIRIPRGAQHRIANNSEEDLYFIEVQYGEYFGEDDIVRIEDDYSRSE